MSPLKLLVPVLLLSALIAVAGCSPGPSKTEGAAAGSPEPVTVRIFAGNLQHGVSQSLKEGQTVKVKTTGVLVGTITSIDVTPSVETNADSEGRLVESSSPLRDDILITLKGSAVVSDTGFRFGNSNLYVNTEDAFLTPTTLLSGVIVSIVPGK